MALDLETKEAINYSGSGSNLLPFEAYGEYDLDLVNYQEFCSTTERELRRQLMTLELGRPVTEDELPPIGYKGSCDIATMVVTKSNSELYPAGSVFGLWFDGDAVCEDMAREAGKSRAFVAACVGEKNPRNPAFKPKAARQSMLTTDLSGGYVKVHLSRRPEPGKGKWQGHTFHTDTFRPIG